MSDPGPIVVELPPIDLAALDDPPLTEAEWESLRERVAQLELTACDFVGDSGCVDPDCWRCHSPLCPENLSRLAENLATAALLGWAWQLRAACPAWSPGCGELPVDLPPLMREALGSSRVGRFLRGSR